LSSGLRESTDALDCCAIRYSYFGTCATLSTMREMSVTEQTSKAVLAVIADGRTVTEAAKDWLVCPACVVAFT
jgi:hypothetical protein